MISPPNSDKIVMWRFLRNRRLMLHLHYNLQITHIFYASTHRAVIFAIAWFSCCSTYYYFYYYLWWTQKSRLKFLIQY